MREYKVSIYLHGHCPSGRQVIVEAANAREAKEFAELRYGGEVLGTPLLVL